MIAIVCQDCEELIEYVDGEKVDVLYGKCLECTPDANAVSETAKVAI